MKTVKLHIRNLSDAGLVERAQRDYSNAFMLLYKALDSAADSDFMEKAKARFNLTDIGYRSLVSDVKAARKQDEENDKERLERIADLEEQLLKTEPEKRYRIYKRITDIRRRVGKERTFGGLSLLRSISGECNRKTPDRKRLADLRRQYREARMMPVFVTGESNQSGNRFFDVTRLHHGKCVYKPRKGERCEIVFKVTHRRELEKLSRYAANKSISVSVRLSKEYLCISYDEELLYGFAVDEKSRREEVRRIKSEHHDGDTRAELIKDVYKKYYREREQRMLEGKIEKRCISVDLNPTNIGWSVLDRTRDGEARVVAAGQYEYGWLCRRLHKPSGSSEQKRLNNKRKHELCVMVRNLFRTAVHYRCSKFVMEDLSFKTDAHQPHESNRKNRNMWCRALVTRLVERRCHENGIELVAVNPCYTSFIGNIRHKFVDATNSSVEIGRRGLWKYENGTFYPEVRREDLSTVEAKFGADADGINTGGWAGMCNALRDLFDASGFSYRLRTAECDSSEHIRFSMDTCRSGVKSLVFTNLH